MIRLRNINKSFNNKKVLDNISFDLPDKGFIGITGKSGSGKTTLLNILSGIVNIDEGNYFIDGINTKSLNNKNWSYFRNQFFGFVFQDYLLIENISVYDNLEVPLLFSNNSIENNKEVIMEHLNHVFMADYIDSITSNLSGGEKQRISIARALINNPKVILADEPTNSLDEDNTRMVMKILKQISKERLVIFVSHDKVLVNSFSDIIIDIDNKEKESNKLDLIESSSDIKYKSKNIIFKPVKLYMKYQKLLVTFLIMALTLTLSSILIISNLISGLSTLYKNSYEDSLTHTPLVVSKYALDIKIVEKKNFSDYFPKDGIVFSKDNNKEVIINNNLTTDYLNYIENMNKDLYYDIIYNYNKKFNFYSTIGNNNISSYIKELPLSNQMLDESYEILKGESFRIDEPCLIIVISNKNEFSKTLLESIGIFNNKITIDDLYNIETYNILNNDLYTKNDNNYKTNKVTNIESDKINKYKVKAVIRSKEVKMFENLESGLYITKGLSDKLTNNSLVSDIVIDQKEKNYDVITGNRFNSNYTREDALSVLGYSYNPDNYQIYPKSFKTKEIIIEYLNNYTGSNGQKVTVTDIGSLVFNTLEDVLKITKIVMLVILVITLTTTTILITIISYFKIHNRKKELVMYQMLGMSNNNVSIIIYFEYLIYIILSAFFSIIISLLTIRYINNWYNKINFLQNPFKFNWINGVSIILIFYLVTVITNLIPIKKLVNKDLNFVFKK